jgi:SagB-type dehydrogenase family enzyme
MTNRDLRAAWTYHNSTKHSYQSTRTNPHFLDWTNNPSLFKIYPTLTPIPLPSELPESEVPALSVLDSKKFAPHGEAPVSLTDLASIFRYSAGITRRRSYPGGEILFRAAACTGALYSIELYAVCGPLDGLEAGIYLFGPADFALRQIRKGDYRGALVHATASESAIAHAPVTIVCTGTYWRNAWKYQARTYRHFGWDNGTILANLLAIATARKLPAKIVLGFVDDDVNRLLDLDTNREVALNIVPIGYSAAAAPQFTGTLDPLNLKTSPYSRHEVDYPAMRQMHAESSLGSAAEVESWRGGMAAGSSGPASHDLLPLAPTPEAELPRDSIEQVIQRRGSSRRFARESITFEQLSTMLYRATQGVPADFIEPAGAQLNDLYLVAHAVDGLKPGAYVLHRNPWGMELLKEGDFRKDTGYLGLEQELPADCSAAVFFMADLDRILKRFGNRGYRATQLEAGIIGGRLYLAAYAQRFGATGLTFYDDDVTRFFSPHAEGKSAIFLVALGKSAKDPFRR